MVQMSDALDLIPALGFGCVLGMLYFAGLWWTIRRGVESKAPAAWFFASLVLRMTGVVLGFFVVAQGHWQKFVACLVGFMMVRFIMEKRLSRATSAGFTSIRKGAAFAP